MNKILIGIGASLGVIVILFLLIFSIGLYGLHWQNNFVNQVVKIIPYPAARVGSFWVSYSDYLNNFAAIKKFYSQQSGVDPADLPDEAQMKKAIMERLVENAILPQLLAKENLTVSQSEIDIQYKALVDAQGNEQSVLDFLNNWYGWTKADYFKYFLIPDIEESKLSQKLVDELPQNIEARNKIIDILKKLKSKESSFEDLAKEYSQDKYAADGGLMGEVPRGYLPSDIEDEIFAAQKGYITDILTLSDSYQIIKVLDINEDQGLVKIARIYIKLKNLNDIIEEYKQKVGVSIYVK